VKVASSHSPTDIDRKRPDPTCDGMNPGFQPGCGDPHAPGGGPQPGGGDPHPGGGEPHPGGGDPQPGGGDPQPAGGAPQPGGEAPRSAGGGLGGGGWSVIRPIVNAAPTA
jgi:hypothetical protein